MILLLKLILISFILVMGWKISTSDKMIFEAIGHWGKKKLDEGHKWADLIICEWCCGTWLSIVGHFVALKLGIVYFELDWNLAMRWLLVVMGTSFVSGMAWTIYLTINNIKENNEAQSIYFKNINNGEN